MAAKNLKLFMLISGQEVIAELVREEPAKEAFVIRQAMMVQLVPRGQDSYGIGLLPLSAINTEGEQLVYNHAVASEAVVVPEDMVNAYIKRTSDFEIVSGAAASQILQSPILR